MFKYILFDLDGTLTNSGEGIIKSLEYAFEQLNLPVPPKTTLEKFIGPPLMVSFTQLMGFDESLSEKAIKKYRERYLVKGIYENYPYDGVEQAVIAARNSGKKVAVATSKPEFMALEVLEHFNLKKHFDVIVGAKNEGESKTDIIVNVLKEFGIDESRKHEVLMVGDRKHDIIGAHNCGIACCGVRYGFAPDGEFEEYGAEYIVNTTEDLADFLKNNKTEVELRHGRHIEY